jgi:hypothetical protein
MFDLAAEISPYRFAIPRGPWAGSGRGPKAGRAALSLYFVFFHFCFSDFSNNF